MVRIEETKERTKHKPIQRANLPLEAYIPLIQHTGIRCQAIKEIGTEVKTGELIATKDSGFFSPIHSSISGKIKEIIDWPHPVLGREKTVVIERDGLDRNQKSDPPLVGALRNQNEIDNLTPNEIRNIVFEAGIVGLGGAGFPTHIKLNPPKKIDSFILNGCECEPYLTSDYRLMVEKTREILLGTELVLKCLGAKNVYIAIEDNKPEAIKAFKKELHTLHITHYTLHILKSYYPQGGEKQIIKNILKREVPSGKLPFDVGCVVHNIGTVFSIYEAVYINKPLYERVVTVTGNCLKNPKNLLVRIGTPIRDLITECGPLIKEPAKVIVGGPMMGISQYTLDTPVIKTTGGVILLTKEEIEETREEFCLHCGECVVSCPMGMYPNLISLAVENQKWDLVRNYSVKDCIECGLCNYVCPAKRALVQSIKKAKIMI